MAGHGERRGVEQVLHLMQGSQQATGPVEVLHQMLPGGLQVDQQRHIRADAVEIVQAERNPQAPGDGQQVHDGIGRSAQCGQGHDRVAERGGRQHLAGTPALLGHFDGQDTRAVRLGEQPAIRGRQAGRTGQRGAERFGQQAHGGGGPHRVAVPTAADH